MSGRFLLFVGDIYYPCGGWEDFTGAFDTLEDAKTAGEARECPEHGWAHIADTDTGAIVANQHKLDPWEDGSAYDD